MRGKWGSDDQEKGAPTVPQIWGTVSDFHYDLARMIGAKDPAAFRPSSTTTCRARGSTIMNMFSFYRDHRSNPLAARRLPHRSGHGVHRLRCWAADGRDSRSGATHPTKRLCSLPVFVLFYFMTNLGPNAMTYLLAGEVFPTHIRGKGAGFAASFAKVGAVLTAFLFPILLHTIGTIALLYMLVFTSVLGAAITWMFAIETPNAGSASMPNRTRFS
jgi:hypothetical protein